VRGERLTGSVFRKITRGKAVVFVESQSPVSISRKKKVCPHREVWCCDTVPELAALQFWSSGRAFDLVGLLRGTDHSGLHGL
jgi:hypothetical protein